MALSLNTISSTIGYILEARRFKKPSGYLPQRIAMLAEANADKQSGLTTTPFLATSPQQVGEALGLGSPGHIMARIMLPIYGGGIQFPLIVYPQLEVASSEAWVSTVTVTGTSTFAVTHNLVVAGRDNIDGLPYSYNISNGDTPTIIAGKMSDAINSVLASPIKATVSAGVLTLTSKWKGKTADNIKLSINNNNVSAGITYAITKVTSGIGTPVISTSLNLFGVAWNTIVMNPYGEDAFSALEQFNGRPDSTPTGRFIPEVWKPFIAIWGSTESNVTTLKAIGDARKGELTNALAPAPNSDGLPFEAAANMSVLFGNVSEKTPNLDVTKMIYPDMPTPENIGDMSEYINRNILVKSGISTVVLAANGYQVQDFVTTFHPDGEVNPLFRYVRSLMEDFNVKYKVLLLDNLYIKGHQIANDSDNVEAFNVIKPKQVVQLLSNLADDLEKLGLISNAAFMKSTILVNINSVNPNRLDKSFDYERSGFVYVISNRVGVGFNFGNN